MVGAVVIDNPKVPLLYLYLGGAKRGGESLSCAWGPRCGRGRFCVCPEPEVKRLQDQDKKSKWVAGCE